MADLGRRLLSQWLWSGRMQGKIAKHLYLCFVCCLLLASVSLWQPFGLVPTLCIDTLLLASLGALFYSLFFLIRRRLLDPIEALGLISEDVAEGRLKKVFHLRQQDEIGELYKKFTAMVMSWQWEREGLVDARERLQDKVSKIESDAERRVVLERSLEELRAEIKSTTDRLIEIEKFVLLGSILNGILHDLASPLQLLGQSYEEMSKRIQRIQQRLFALLGDADDPDVQAVRREFSQDFTVQGKLLEEIKLSRDLIAALHGAMRNQARSDSELGETALRPVLDECCLILKSKLKLWRWKIDCTDELLVVCRRSQLCQVLLNLIANACDALRQRDAKENVMDLDLLISAYAVDPLDPGSAIIIDIEDDGDGVVETDKDKIFQAFYSTKAIGDAIGMGLPVCRRILEAHGGTLNLVPSRKLRGACLRLILPSPSLEPSDLSEAVS